MDTSSLREFAFKKLQEARERGTELAAVTAARAASSIASSVPASSAYVFRAHSSAEQSQQQQLQPLSMEKKLESHKMCNDLLRAKLTGTNGSMDEILIKLDLVNESLAFSIENIHEGAHVMSLLNRQLKDSAAMKCPWQISFYQQLDTEYSIKNA